MLGRPRESARLAPAGLEAMRRYGIHTTLLVSNHVEALLATGDWDEADGPARPRSGLAARYPDWPSDPRRRRDRPWRVRRRASPH